MVDEKRADLYRLNDQREIDELGLDEIAAEGVLAIEWAEKLPRSPSEAIRVTIKDAGEERRSMTVDMQNAE